MFTSQSPMNWSNGGEIISKPSKGLITMGTAGYCAVKDFYIPERYNVARFIYEVHSCKFKLNT